MYQGTNFMRFMYLIYVMHSPCKENSDTCVLNHFSNQIYRHIVLLDNIRFVEFVTVGYKTVSFLERHLNTAYCYTFGELSLSYALSYALNLLHLDSFR